jgi:hypothetical protein
MITIIATVGKDKYISTGSTLAEALKEAGSLAEFLTVAEQARAVLTISTH